MSHFRIILLFLVLTVIGFASIFLIEVDFTPKSIETTYYIRYTTNHNDTPLVTEQSVTSVLEGSLSTLDGLKGISSVSRQGGGFIKLTFGDDQEMQQKRLEILTIIRQLKSQLPPELPFPSIELGGQQTTEEPLLIYSLSSSLPINEIVNKAREQVITKIGVNPGLKEVSLSADNRPVLILSYNTDRLSSHGVAPETLKQALSNFLKSEQIGTISSHGTTKSLMINTSPDDISELLNVFITENLQLGDLVHVKMEEMSKSYISRLNGLNSILVQLYAHQTENKVVLATELKDAMDQLSTSLPSTLSIQLVYDDSEFISEELAKVSERAGLSMFILCCLVFLVYRKWKPFIILMASIIVCISVSSLMMYLADVSIHLYTLAGLTISFGLVIDNAIMVIDHLKRRSDLKVMVSLLAATITTIAALLIIFILPTEDRLGMTDFAISIAIALGSSILVSLFFTPSLTKLIGMNKNTRPIITNTKRKSVALRYRYYRMLNFLAGHKKIVATVMILLFGFPVYLIPATIPNFDHYNDIVTSDAYQKYIKPASERVFGGTLRLFYHNVFETGGYRTPEKTRLYLSASLDNGHTIDQMNDIMRSVEKYLKQIEGLKNYRTAVYSGQYAQVSIEFKEAYENGSLPHVLRDKLIQRSLDWGGIEWEVYGIGRGFDNTRSESFSHFRVKLFGYQNDGLESISDELAASLMSHPRVDKVNKNDRVTRRDENVERLTIIPNSAISPKEYMTSVNYLKNQAPRTSQIITINNNQIPVIYIDHKEDDLNVYELQNGSDGVPMKGISELQRKLVPNALYRENRAYIRVLSFDYQGSYRFGEEYLKEVLGSFQVPPGYSYDLMEFQRGSEKTTRQYSLIPLIIILIYVVCTVTFESIRLPLIVVFLIPLSFIGVFITFSLGDFYFDQGGYAAFVLLSGIVVNAMLFILVDARNHNSGHWNHSITKTCFRKLTPILLTIFSTCLGLAPFLINGQQEVFWFSFAIGVIGGLIFSIFLVFIVFPSLLMTANKKPTLRSTV